MKDKKGFSLIEVIVAVAIMAILAGAIVPVVFNRLDQARQSRMMQDMQAIYEAAMGVPDEDYFGFVGDVGRLPDSTAELISNPGLTSWNGPYLSLGGNMKLQDVYSSDYVIDTDTIQVRSYGPNRVDDLGAGDDLFYPENALNTYRGNLEVQVFINGRLISDPDPSAENVTVSLSYFVDGVPSSLGPLSFSSDYAFTSGPVHQGSHVVAVSAAKVVAGGDGLTAEHNEQLTILPGATTRIRVNFEDPDYMTRLDTDLNNNGIPDRLEDMDGDGVPDDSDPDTDGDGTPDAIDPYPYDPTLGGGGGGGGGGGAPTVISVTPNNGELNSTNYPLIIIGTDFQTGVTVTFSGDGITVPTTTYVSDTQVDVEVNISATATPGWRNVTVLNPDGSTGTGTNKFEVVDPGGPRLPAITAVVPSQATQGDSDLLISIQGNNFVSPTAIAFSNTDIIAGSPVFIDDTEVQVTISVPLTASTGAGDLTITNPPPDNGSSTVVFTVNVLPTTPPVITGFSPASVLYNIQNTWVDINGSNFVNGLTVTSGNPLLEIKTTNVLSTTLIQIKVGTGFTDLGQEVQVTVTNPDGGSASAPLHITGANE